MWVCTYLFERVHVLGTSTGAIRAIKFPLTDVSDFQEHEAHSGPVTKLRISYDDQYLFSSSEDGCVYVFRIADKDEHTIKRDKGIIFSDEVSFRPLSAQISNMLQILITKSDLEEKTVLMGELQRSLEELKLEHEYQLRLKDMNFNEKLKDITDRYSQEIEALKISTSVLRTEKDKEDVKHQEELQNMKSKQVQEIHVNLLIRKLMYHRKWKPSTTKNSWKNTKSFKRSKKDPSVCRRAGNKRCMNLKKKRKRSLQ